MSQRRLFYITDLEGDLGYFTRILNHKKCPIFVDKRKPGTTPLSGLPYGFLKRDGITRKSPPKAPTITNLFDLEHFSLEFKDDSTELVFGGDLFDHGQDICLAHALLDLKARYSSRTHLILGNRDINKLIMPRIYEDAASHTAKEAECMLFGIDRSKLPEALSRTSEVSYPEYLKSTNRVSSDLADPVSFLQWGLKYKMGSSRAFIHRKNELEATLGTDVSEREVADSFFDAAKIGGAYCEYLRNASIMTVIDSILFVHGGINDDNVGVIPDPNAKWYEQKEKARNLMKEGHDFFSWRNELEAFKNRELDDWMNGRGNKGEALRMYAIPKRVAPHSVVVGSFVDLHGPAYSSLNVIEYLLQSGISTVCAGHQPCGDSPAVVQQPGGFTMIDADNSYCGKEHSTDTNSRWKGLNIVEFGENGVCTLEGCRADGSPFLYQVGTGVDNNSGGKLLGRSVGDGWWVKVRLAVRRSHTDILLSKYEG
ncbi:hypothetical protein AGDE_03281 [Angomonas deanei]|uniref:Calcineurin-like phosphoesterase, putative n=1 Tax=Angomonas deanei TaxID=59799 RepID=A0A7G2CSE4_9TRYP|nr:hypothetical protein AGDE_03281 [Angomonas deanei]CAD2222475.1 Calcineurin-like phosphoesterase, putative [Angomonas deanei]|eukprot:EPY40647.1 hypothetical protein AGDE_03281 [Angomonas deanei]